METLEGLFVQFQLDLEPLARIEQQPGSDFDQNAGVYSISFKKFGMIKEFGGVDNAAVFGWLPETGKFQITKITGPHLLTFMRLVS